MKGTSTRGVALSETGFQVLTGAVTSRETWRMAALHIRGLATAAAALAVLCGCASQPDPTGGASTKAASPFALYTHCGIYEARVQDTFYVANEPLDDGHGNPPAGWANPYQSGTITVGGPTAVFSDDAGHIVTFYERPGATSFLITCS